MTPVRGTGRKALEPEVFGSLDARGCEDIEGDVYHARGRGACVGRTCVLGALWLTGASLLVACNGDGSSSRAPRAFVDGPNMVTPGDGSEPPPIETCVSPPTFDVPLVIANTRDFPRGIDTARMSGIDDDRIAVVASTTD